MPKKSNTFIAALASFLGTTIGVGIFALPYTYKDSYLASLLVLVGTGLILMSLYKMYIEILLEKGIGIHQLPGIVSKIWGKRAKNAVGIVLILGRTGIMFLYTIILADFGSLLLENVLNISISPFIISSVVTFIVSLAIVRHARFKSKIELYLSSAILGIIGVISTSGILLSLLSDTSALEQLFIVDTVLNSTSFSGSMNQLGVIYGVTIGALSGIAAIPALKEISNDKKILTRVTRVGTFIVIVLYALFALFVITASDQVTQDALHGLGDEWWVTILAFAGFISILTSYLGVGFSLFEVYLHDYSLPKITSWLLTLLPPIILLATGFDDFVAIAALVGGVIGGTEGLIILASYWKLENSNSSFPITKKIPIVLTAIILALGLLLVI